jgi:hypothetical protein
MEISEQVLREFISISEAEFKRRPNSAAATIAIDAAKSLINISVAFFAALGAFALTYRSTHATFSWSWSIALLSVSAVLTIISMIAGFGAIGLAYRMGQCPTNAAGLPWATRPLSPYFRTQSLAVLGALTTFAVAVFAWDAGSTTTADARIDGLQGRIEGLQARLDQQVGDLSKIVQVGTATSQQNSAVLAELPGKVDAVVTALALIQADIARTPPALPVVTPENIITPTPAPATDQPPRQEKDLSRTDWLKIQDALIALGFKPGKPDGDRGTRTRQAIRAYQARMGATQSGHLTSHQIEALLGAH